MVATEPFIGREVLRKEDGDLVTGQANYIDNQTMPGMLWMAMVRPPYVHATDRFDRYVRRRRDAAGSSASTPPPTSR